MKIANRAKRFCRCFHRVAHTRSGHKKINTPWRTIVSLEFDDPSPATLCLLAYRGDFSFFGNKLKPIANCIRKNQPRIRKNHFRLTLSLECSTFNAKRRQLRLDAVKSILFGAMDSEYDVVIIGGAFSGAATALMLKRKRPKARVLIIEKTAEFDRKVGESTTEVSSCYMTRILGLTHYLGHHQLAKQGLRLWFSNRPDQRFDDCVEVGTRYQSRLPGFQVDRAKLDSHMLDLAEEAGCELWRPAKVANLELNNGNGQRVSASLVGGECTVRARWIVDATGRAATLGRKLGYFRPNTEHPINAVWARFSGVKEWDSYEWRQRFPDYANRCRTAREWATNHLLKMRLVGLDHSIARRRCQRRYRLRQPYFQAPGRTESRSTIAHPHPRQPGWPRNFWRSPRDRRRRTRLVHVTVSLRKSLRRRLGRSGRRRRFYRSAL